MKRRYCQHCGKPGWFIQCAGCNKVICRECVRWFTATSQEKRVVCPACFERGTITVPGVGW